MFGLAATRSPASMRSISGILESGRSRSDAARGCDGAVLGRDVQTIEPGQAVFFDLPFDASREENRIEVRPIVNVSAGPDKSLRITIEVFDPVTGKTAVYIGDPNL